MPFKPLDKLCERVEAARDESDTALFLSLMYLGEAVLKTVTAGFLATVSNEKERLQYRVLHRLVRADGVGEWSAALDDVLSGVASASLSPQIRGERNELTQKCASGAWQYQTVSFLYECVKKVESLSEALPAKVELRRWFSDFARLRNKTRGHGAVPGEMCSQICPLLEESLLILISKVAIFRRPWAYLHQQMNGRYKVTRISGEATLFDYLKKPHDPIIQLPDGVYVFVGQPLLVHLIGSNQDTSDFYYPNGNFGEKTFELLSYISGTTRDGDSSDYLLPPSDLPRSETSGVGLLDSQGNCFGNLPPRSNEYIHRPTLEDELRTTLLDDRHPVVTIHGSGGIGKTSMALSVLYQLTEYKRFEAIVWFSARDIDLLPEGPKSVRPDVVTQNDIAKEYVRLIEPTEAKVKGFDANAFFQGSLTKSCLGEPILFVFDNFETVKSPGEAFKWISTYVRSPNKVLITSRIRDFKGDYPVEVFGMEEQEAASLIEITAQALGISDRLNEDYRKELFRESDGHPYVIKVLLGEVAKSGRVTKLERIIADRDDILTALFERTYATLSPSAKRIFLTLCGWRSVIPHIVLEAVLLRPANERMDVAGGIEELRRSSLLEIIESEKDHHLFLVVPMTASVFGRTKLNLSPLREAVTADVEKLHLGGAIQESDIRHGLAPRIERLFRDLSRKISRGHEKLTEYLPILEFLARKYPRARLLLAQLYEERGDNESLLQSKSALEAFLSVPGDPASQSAAWAQYAKICHRSGDIEGELHAMASRCECKNNPAYLVKGALKLLYSTIRLNPEKFKTDQSKHIIRTFIKKMDANNIRFAEGEDFSVLASLSVHVGDMTRAREFALLATRASPRNQRYREQAEGLGLKRNHDSYP